MKQIIGEPSMPEWTAEARDIAEILTVLTARFNSARNRSALLSQKPRDHTVPSNVSISNSVSNSAPLRRP